MNITSPILTSAARVAELPADSVASLLKIVGFGTGLFDDSPDGGLGIIMSALSGVAAALAVAGLLPGGETDTVANYVSRQTTECFALPIAVTTSTTTAGKPTARTGTNSAPFLVVGGALLMSSANAVTEA